MSTALKKQLIEYWPLDEASGTRRGAFRGLDLTDNNTVTGNPGTCGSLASQFASANTEYLSRVSEDVFNPQGSFTFSTWVYMDSKPTNSTILSKYEASAGTSYWLLHEGGSDRFSLYVSPNAAGSGQVNLLASSFGSPSLSTWYFIIFSVNKQDQRLEISVNNGTMNTTSFTSDVYVSTSPFRIGNWQHSVEYPWNGRIQRVGFWDRLLSAEEKTFIYNSGCGKDWPFYSN